MINGGYRSVKMIISFLVAVDKNKLIGRAGKLPWHLPADLAYFKQVTMGHTIVMGRKTYESIGRPLPGRVNVILTRDRSFTADNCVILHSVEEVLEKYKDTMQELFIIGGSEIFVQFFPFVDKLYITKLESEFEGDTYFPDYDINKWKVVSEEKGIIDAENLYEHTYYIYDRK
jgi:dihydrofolate reductase